MTDDIDKPSQELTVQQRAAIGKTTPNGVSGRLKAALDDMTWNGTPWEEAATKANLTVRAMRLIDLSDDRPPGLVIVIQPARERRQSDDAIDVTPNEPEDELR
jgi:hypothetical protein